MDGITILQTVPTTIYESAINGWAVFWLIATVISIITTVACAGVNDSAWIIFAVLTGLCFVFAWFKYDTAIEIPGPDKYQVIIDESVSLTEFYDRYEVIEQEGITFWIKEKPVEENINND